MSGKNIKKSIIFPNEQEDKIQLSRIHTPQ